MAKICLLVLASTLYATRASAGICDSTHNLQCYGEDLKDVGPVHSHETCCQACQQMPGCKAWTWNWKHGQHCYLKSGCSDRRTSSDAYHSGIASGPPSPGPSPTPGHSDLAVQWITGRGHGACNGPVAQGSDVVELLGGNDIKLTTDHAPHGGCVFRTASPAINLDEFPHIEADLHTSGNAAAYGQKGGQWFSFWMYPPGYAYQHGIAESGEVDFVENINSVRTNFAGCRHNCHETSWGQQSNNVRAHVTMHYDKASETVNVYRCQFGAASCGSSSEKAYVELKAMKVQKPYIYTLCTDVWYAQPGFNFHFTVSNLRILRSAATNMSASVIV